MGWIKNIETEIGILGLWELDDSLNDLLPGFRFSENERATFDAIKFERRKLEFLVVRLLVDKLLQTKSEIYYDEAGCPHLKDNPLNISISHSHELVVAFLSERRIGIDAENITRNIEKVATRFLSENEKKQVTNAKNVNATMVLYWSAKEAVFKCAGLQNVQFNRDIRISRDENENNERFCAELIKNNLQNIYTCQSFLFKNNVVVYCVEENRKILSQ